VLWYSCRGGGRLDYIAYLAEPQKTGYTFEGWNTFMIYFLAGDILSLAMSNETFSAPTGWASLLLVHARGSSKEALALRVLGLVVELCQTYHSRRPSD
jgi:hypothetical protein